MTYDNNFITNNQLKVIFKYFDYGNDIYKFYTLIRAMENQVFDYINFDLIKKYNLYFSLNQFSDDKDFLLTNTKKIQFLYCI